MKKQCPGLKLVFSYADKTNQGHHGGVYQADNWVYLGERKTGDKGAYYFIHGKKVHGRSARAKYGHESKFPKGWTHAPSETKYLYMKPLNSTYQFEYRKKAYPKRAVSKDNVAFAHQAEGGGVNPTTALPIRAVPVT